VPSCAKLCQAVPSCAKLQACLQQLKHYWPGRFSQRHAATLPWLEDRNRHNVSQPIGSMYAIYGNIYHQYTPNVSIYTIHGSYGQCHTMSKCVDVGFERCGAQFLSHGRRSKMPRSEVSTEVDDWFVAFSGLLNINLHIIIDIMYIYTYVYIIEVWFLVVPGIDVPEWNDSQVLPQLRSVISPKDLWRDWGSLSCQSHPVY